MPETVFMKLCMYIMAPESLSAVYFINPFHQFVSVCASPTFAWERLGKNVTAATNAYATIEELLNA
jgi:hypothetical protein